MMKEARQEEPRRLIVKLAMSKEAMARNIEMESGGADGKAGDVVSQSVDQGESSGVSTSVVGRSGAQENEDSHIFKKLKTVQYQPGYIDPPLYQRLGSNWPRRSNAN